MVRIVMMYTPRVFIFNIALISPAPAACVLFISSEKGSRVSNPS